MEQHNKKKQIMINFDDIKKENIKEHKKTLSQIPDYPYIILTYGSSETNVLFDLMCQQPDIDKIYLYAKDPYEAKYQLLFNKKGKYRHVVFKWFLSFY